MSKQYSKSELEDSLKRAFVDNEADYIIMDGQQMRNEFLVDGINYGLDKGWLYQAENIDEDEILGQSNGQYLAYTYRLTNKGKKYFNIQG
jgi:hypothetical protein